jgi:hypothetical protein
MLCSRLLATDELNRYTDEYKELSIIKIMGNFDSELRDFLEKKPLYLWQKFELLEESTQLSLSQIEMECPTCRRSRPFSDRRPRGSGMGLSTPKLESSIYPFWFTCDSCSSSRYTFFVEIDVEKSKIRKIGQSPAWSINIDGDIDKFLEDKFCPAVWFK